MDRKEKMCEMYESGMLYREIATVFGVSPQRVHQIITGYRSPASRYIPSEKTIRWRKKLLTKYASKLQKREEFIKNSELIALELRSKNLPTHTLPHISGGRDKFRERIRIRDNHTCRMCKKVWKKGRRFDVHHTDPKMEGRSSERGIIKLDKENADKMITLCHKCHLNLDHIREKLSKTNTISTNFYRHKVNKMLKLH